MPVHVPAIQKSLVVHRSPSEQVVRSGTLATSHAPVALLHWRVLHCPAPVELHTTGLAVHLPCRHLSPVVQRLPSLQAVLSGAGRSVQSPVASTHSDTVHGTMVLPPAWRRLRALVHVLSVPEQTPAVHLSSMVQFLPSLQVVLSGLGTRTQVPFANWLYVRHGWRRGSAGQVAGGLHTPLWHVPTLQGMPSALLDGTLHAPVVGSQDSLLHSFAGSSLGQGTSHMGA